MAIIAGGSAAGLVQSLTAITRGASALTTSGLGNPVVCTAEITASLGISTLAIFFPFMIGIVVLLLLAWAGRKVFRKSRRA